MYNNYSSYINYSLIDLAVGGAKAILVTAQIPVPLQLDTPPNSVISSTHFLCKGGVLAMDYHPVEK